MNRLSLSSSSCSSSRCLERKMAFLSLFDHLYCQEESLELEEEEEEETELALPVSDECETDTERQLSEAAAAEEWEEVLCFLLGKEMEALPQAAGGGGGGGDCYLRLSREEAVEWIVSAVARHGFSALTAMLAVNYFDRCFLAGDRGALLRLQEDKPWMGRLAAVACLSLAAKVEETHVPFLLDLQVPAPAAVDGGFVFEPKTVRRMELLVLSALGWEMNPVTPLSFIHHLLPRIHSQNKSGSSAAGSIAVFRIRESARCCEAAFLTVIADWRWVLYPASAWAAAALLHVAESGDGSAESREIRRLISLLNSPKEKLEQCYRLMAESTTASAAIAGRKRKQHSSPASSPASPSGVIGSCFSCESSCDSWAARWPSSVSSSPEVPPLFKRLNAGINSADGELREKGALF